MAGENTEHIVAPWLTILGLSAVTVLSCTALRPDPDETVSTTVPVPVASPREAAELRLLAVGDVNLGRAVGQELLKGDTLYPFATAGDTLRVYDIVFANLESNLSDQQGETQSPRNNLVFSGPPEGARALRCAGVTVVSTANNHALDYGRRARDETMQNLRDAGVLFAGTSPDSTRLYGPAVVRRKGISVAFFACTEIMNGGGRHWSTHVGDADTAKIFPLLRAWRDSVDFIVLSYHGGDEYADRPARRTLDFARAAIDAGADLFLGHHPHVAYGVEERDGRYIIPSLGNFVFSQMTRYWTQWSFAFSAVIRKDRSGTRVSLFRCLPVAAGFQPRFIENGTDAAKMYSRIRTLSSRVVAEQIAW